MALRSMDIQAPRDEPHRCALTPYSALNGMMGVLYHATVVVNDTDDVDLVVPIINLDRAV